MSTMMNFTVLFALMVSPTMSQHHDFSSHSLPVVLVRGDGGGRDPAPADQNADLELVHSFASQRCFSADTDPDFGLPPGIYSKKLCSLSIELGEQRLLLKSRSGEGPRSPADLFSEQSSDLQYEAPLGDLDPSVIDWSGGSVGIKCKDEPCIRVTGWAVVSRIPGQAAREEFDVLEEELLFPLESNAIDKEKFMRALSRLISPDHSDAEFCAKYGCE